MLDVVADQPPDMERDHEIGNRVPAARAKSGGLDLTGPALL
jgi:hypothetical protein